MRLLVLLVDKLAAAAPLLYLRDEHPVDIGQAIGPYAHTLAPVVAGKGARAEQPASHIPLFRREAVVVDQYLRRYLLQFLVKHTYTPVGFLSKQLCLQGGLQGQQRRWRRRRVASPWRP